MKILVDTNILGRMTEPGHPQYQLALDATAALRLQGGTLYVVPQVLYEFWVTSTRPKSANGLGFSAAEAAAELAKIKTLFTFLADTPTIYPEWERLIILHQVTGKNAHDARLVAAMAVHGLGHLLTFNVSVFSRFPGVIPLNPAALGASSPPSP